MKIVEYSCLYAATFSWVSKWVLEKKRIYLSYSIEEYKHRFASWAAARGASVINNRFKVEIGKLILEDAGLKNIANSINNLPSYDDFDKYHKEWRISVINVAKNYNLDFTHGVAAKLINLYLKSIYVCGESINDPRIKNIHPPIDSLLLDELYKQDIGQQKIIWQKAKKAKWSKFTSDEYEEVIKAIKKSTPVNFGLWEIEQYWRGFQ